MQTIGQLIDQLSVNALKVAKYEQAPEPRAPEIARRLEDCRRQHRDLTVELECATILTLFGMRPHRPFRQAKTYGGKLS